MRRSEIRWVDLDPTRGAESNKRRPAVIVSNDGANTTASRLGRGIVTVVPVTSNVEKVYAFKPLGAPTLRARQLTPSRRPNRSGPSPWSESVH
jgi:mRNA-degrading endonuclease toxin of MazEF toxin-antitoxin module